MTRRLLVTYVSLTALVVAMLGVPLAWAFQHDAQHERTLQVQSGTSTLATLVDDSLEHPTGVTVPILAERYAGQLDARVVVLDANRRPLAAAGRSEPLGPFTGIIAHAPTAQATSGSAAGLLYVTAPVSGGGHVITIYRPVGVSGSVRHYWLLIGALGVAALLAAVVLGLVLARTITRPVRALERATTAAGEGRLTTRVPESGPPELRSLARSFNLATAKLDRVLAAQAAWVSDASHQLRTPLAALQLRLENLQHDADSQNEEELEAAQAEVHRLTRLTDGLLVLGRLDGAGPASQSIELEPLITERVSLWSALAEEHAVRIAADVVGHPVIASEEGRIEQVLDNLLSNALEASPAKSTITVRAFPANGQVEIHVIDEGAGLSREDRERAFERFWRAGNGEGSGLGLAIVRQLVRADQGDVELRPAASGGSTPSSSFPASLRPARTRCNAACPFTSATRARTTLGLGNLRTGNP
jgi:signal transduction histidine kinase